MSESDDKSERTSVSPADKLEAAIKKLDALDTAINGQVDAANEQFNRLEKALKPWPRLTAAVDCGGVVIAYGLPDYAGRITLTPLGGDTLPWQHHSRRLRIAAAGHLHRLADEMLEAAAAMAREKPATALLQGWRICVLPPHADGLPAAVGFMASLIVEVKDRWRIIKDAYGPPGPCPDDVGEAVAAHIRRADARLRSATDYVLAAPQCRP